MFKTITLAIVVLSSTSYASFKPRPATLKDLASDVQSISIDQGNGGPAGKCSFQAKAQGGVLTLIVKSQNRGQIVVRANNSTKITLIAQKTSSDGSFVRK